MHTMGSMREDLLIMSPSGAQQQSTAADPNRLNAVKFGGAVPNLVDYVSPYKYKNAEGTDPDLDAESSESSSEEDPEDIIAAMEKEMGIKEPTPPPEPVYTEWMTAAMI